MEAITKPCRHLDLFLREPNEESDDVSLMAIQMSTLPSQVILLHVI
jgi:hypothetical protein